MASAGDWWRVVAGGGGLLVGFIGWWRVVASGGEWWRVVESFIRCLFDCVEK